MEKHNKRHKKRHEVTEEEWLVGAGMYIIAAIAAVIGTAISCRQAWIDQKAQEASEEKRHLLDSSSSEEDESVVSVSPRTGSGESGRVEKLADPEPPLVGNSGAPAPLGFAASASMENVSAGSIEETDSQVTGSDLGDVEMKQMS